MAKTTGAVDGWTLEQEVEQIEVTSLSAKPNPGWDYTDAAGHRHTHAEPNLVEIIQEPWYCPDCREVHDNMLDHYECPDCGEHIVPGTLPGPHREFIPGLVTITAIGPDGTRYHLSPEMLDLILERLKFQGARPGLIASLVAPHTLPCPRGGTHIVDTEEGSSGQEYRFCRGCATIFDGPVTL